MKKINIGIILAIITIISMIFYLVIEEKTRKQDIINIKSFLDEYYQVYNKYSVLHEEDRDIDKVIDKSKYDKYKEEMKQELAKYLINDKYLKDRTCDKYIKKIDEQIEGKYIYNKNEKSILEVSGDRKIYTEEQELPAHMIYKNGYIFVTVKIQIDVDKTSRLAEIYNKEKEKFVGDTKKQVGLERTIEVLVLKKVNGKFKIMEHSMTDPIRFSFDEDMKAFYIN